MEVVAVVLALALPSHDSLEALNSTVINRTKLAIIGRRQ